MVDNIFYSLDDLLYLMQRLRNPNDGCPWDIKQNYASIAPSTIEEAYEVVDAIERQDLPHLKEELGDLLFQVVFYSQLGSEEADSKKFNFNDIVHGLTTKLIRRHPHVFPDECLQSRRDSSVKVTDESIKQSWEAIKALERIDKGKVGILADIPRGLPAFTRALKLQKRASKENFDWHNTCDVMVKVKEEIAEFEEVLHLFEQQKNYTSDDKAIENIKLKKQLKEQFEEEMGDILFSCVNMSRHLSIDPESALRRANAKFTSRFEYIESKALENNQKFSQLSSQEMEYLWKEAKKIEQKS